MIWAYVVYWVGAAFDGWTTERGLDRGGREKNKRVRWFIETMGDRGLFVVKTLGFIVLLLSDAPAWAYYVLGAGQLVVGFRNLKILLKMKRRSDGKKG